jgi:hypothetical protein
VNKKEKVIQSRARFDPRATGSRTATISLSDDAPDGPHAIQLVGVGTDVARPNAQIYLKSYSFGQQPVHTRLPVSALSLFSVLEANP